MNYKLKSKICSLEFLIIIIIIFCSISILGVTEEQSNGKTEKPDNKDANNPSDQDKDKLLEELDKELKPTPVEEEVDPIGILNKVVDKMESAEDKLSTASNLDTNEHKITDTATAKQRHQEAIDELNKIFQQIKKLQSDATDGLDKIIRSARVVESNNQGNDKKPKPQPKHKPKPKPQDKKDGKDSGQGGPAPRAYDAKSELPNGFTRRRSDGLKWGNLPPKLRDEIIQSAQEEFLPEYQERLSRYFKILAGKE